MEANLNQLFRSELFSKFMKLCTGGILLLMFNSVFFSPTAQAKDKANKADKPPKMINELPVNWDYYAVDRALLEKYSGEARQQICFDEDFDSQAGRYGRIEPFGVSINRKASQRGGYLLTGLKDFVVIDKKHVLIGTPKTGMTLVEARFCKKSLRRAKLLVVPTERQGSCLREREALTIFTRLTGTIDVCKVGKIHIWNGPTDVDKLRDENKALNASLKNKQK